MYTFFCRRFWVAHGSLAQLGEHLPYKQGVVGSNPTIPRICMGEQHNNAEEIRILCDQPVNGPVVQLVRTLACHARGRGFEPHPGRMLFKFVEHRSLGFYVLRAESKCAKARKRTKSPSYVQGFSFKPR